MSSRLPSTGRSVRHCLTRRLEQLETRLAPAVATWDGGGADNHWTTAANWVGDVAPQPGDDLVFPGTAQQITNLDDFPAGTAFHSLRVTVADYRFSGNAIALAGGIVFQPIAFGDVLAPGSPSVGLPITLTADQTFDNQAGDSCILTGAVDLNGHALTFKALDSGSSVDVAGDISGAGSVTFTSGTVAGSPGSCIVSGHNTYTGPTRISGALVTLSGSIAGPVTIQGGVGDIVFPRPSLSGNGSVGDVTVPVGSLGNVTLSFPAPPPSTLSTGNLTLSDSAAVKSSLHANGSDRIAVVGSVRLAGALHLYPDFQPVLGQQFTIIDNDGTDPVVGTFDKATDNPLATVPEFTTAAEGSVLLGKRFGDFGLRISYKGGDGNDVTLTVVALPAYAVGAGPGGFPVVNVYNGTGALVRSFNAYETSFRGGVHVATADVTGDGVPDTITAPGFGGGPLVRIWDGQTGAMVKQFLAYDEAFRGGVNLAAANITTVEGQGLPNIITGAGPSGGPHVKVFDAATLNTVSSFFAFDTAFRGGVTVAGIPRLLGTRTLREGMVAAGAGPGGLPFVRLFNGETGSATGVQFMAYDPGFRGGVSVAWDGSSVMTAPGAGSPPLVRRFFVDGSPGIQFMVYDPRFLGGVSLATHLDRIVTGAGAGGVPLVREWEFNFTRVMREFFAFDPAFTGGVFVG